MKIPDDKTKPQLRGKIDGFDREIELTCQNSELMAFLDQRGRSTKTVSAAEARARLGLTSS